MHTIVAATGNTPRSGSVLHWAAREADLSGAGLVALTASGGSEHAGSDLDTTLRDELDNWVETVLPPEQAAATGRAVVREPPFDALVKASADADLLVMGTGRHHLPWTRHELTARVLALATCPVAVVADQPLHDTGRIAVGVDGSPASLAALRWAARRAAHTGADVIAVTAWRCMAGEDTTVFPYGVAEHDSEAAAVEILTGTLAQLPGHACQQIIDQGHPVDVLLDISRYVDLLVVGNRGTSAFDDRRLGASSRRLAQRASCPVLITHDTDATTST